MLVGHDYLNPRLISIQNMFMFFKTNYWCKFNGWGMNVFGHFLMPHTNIGLTPLFSHIKN
jgi:hypothetical protein